MFMELAVAVMAQNLQDQGYNIEPKELACVAQNVYFEARGESVMDQIYVANVTMNRVHDKQKRWAETPCKVVYQPYQFSWTSNPNKVKEAARNIESSEDKQKLWTQIVETSALVMVGLIDDHTGGANHYHRKDVRPKWVVDYTVSPTLTASVHVFYTDKKKSS